MKKLLILCLVMVFAMLGAYAAIAAEKASPAKSPPQAAPAKASPQAAPAKASPQAAPAKSPPQASPAKATPRAAPSQSAPQGKPRSFTISGYIIDNNCAEAHKADIAVFAAKHGKNCALKPENIKSGYSIYAEGRLWAFDEESNPKVAEFLKKAAGKSLVEVKLTPAINNQVRLLGIKNKE